MNHFDRQNVVGRADRYAPGNPPEHREDDEPLRCPWCKCVTDDGEACAECRQLQEEESHD